DPGDGHDSRAPQGRPARAGHAPGAARQARHLLPAVPAAVQGRGAENCVDHGLRTNDDSRLKSWSAVCSPKSYLKSGPIATKNRQSLLPKLAPAKIGPISDSATAPTLTLVRQSCVSQSSHADAVSSHDPTNMLPPRTSGNRAIRFR